MTTESGEPVSRYEQAEKSCSSKNQKRFECWNCFSFATVSIRCWWKNRSLSLFHTFENRVQSIFKSITNRRKKMFLLILLFCQTAHGRRIQNQNFKHNFFSSSLFFNSKFLVFFCRCSVFRGNLVVVVFGRYFVLRQWFVSRSLRRFCLFPLNLKVLRLDFDCSMKTKSQRI